MSQLERIQKIQQILELRTVVPREHFLEELEISLATFKRDLEFLRSRLQFDIQWSRERGGYYRVGNDGKLPGPLYTEGEIHALLLMQDLMAQLQPGLLEKNLIPLRERLKLLLGADSLQPEQIRRRIRILHMTSRPVGPKHFQVVSMATLSRQRLYLTYRSRSSGEDTAREVSPQRLVYYRANWYLDSWCHLRNELRSFALDMIREAEIRPGSADEIPDQELDAHLGSGYGIFAGAARETAVLRFEPHIAQWVSREIWHARQSQRFEESGHFILSVPYAQEYELAMDILRYGANVEVLAPAKLRRNVQAQLRDAAGLYEPDRAG